MKLLSDYFNPGAVRDMKQQHGIIYVEDAQKLTDKKILRTRSWGVTMLSKLRGIMPDESPKFSKGQNACILKAGESEPLFVLRSQDVTSPKIILLWMAENVETLTELRLMEAFECVLEMKKFPTRKIPD